MGDIKRPSANTVSQMYFTLSSQPSILMLSFLFCHFNNLCTFSDNIPLCTINTCSTQVRQGNPVRIKRFKGKQDSKVTQFKNMRYRLKQRILKRRLSNGKKVFKEIFNILSNQRNSNHNNFSFILSLMISPFQVSFLKTPCVLAFMRVFLHTRSTTSASLLQYPLHWGTKPPQDEGLSLPFVSDKAVLCYICICCQESLHVYTLVGGLVPGSPKWSS